jgi:flagellar basal body-associated protein FliL
MPAAAPGRGGNEMTVSRLVALVALVFCFVAGYFLASWWGSSARDTSPLAQICARIDYVNGLQESLKGQEAASEEVRAEFKALVEQCRAALRNRADEND